MGPWKELCPPAGATTSWPSCASRPSCAVVSDDPGQIDDAEGAPPAAAFDDPAVTELRVFNLGDGEAMSGLLVAGRRQATGEATFLVFLMD